jgi:hypothetical protein
MFPPVFPLSLRRLTPYRPSLAPAFLHVVSAQKIVLKLLYAMQTFSEKAHVLGLMRRNSAGSAQIPPDHQNEE